MTRSEQRSVVLGALFSEGALGEEGLIGLVARHIGVAGPKAQEASGQGP